MAKTSQAHKYSLGLAGEFLVAGELLRRGVTAAVTYGNAKKTDVVAVQGSRSCALEIKATSQARWVLGNSLPEDSDVIWVLVYLPPDTGLAPVYFVLLSRELREVALVRHLAYHANYEAKRGHPFTGSSVVSVTRDEIEKQHRSGSWDKIDRALAIHAG